MSWENTRVEWEVQVGGRECPHNLETVQPSMNCMCGRTVPQYSWM